MIIKIHRVQGAKIVALCDEDIVGKEIEEGNIYLNLGLNFYKGEKRSEEYIEVHLKTAKIINAVGKKSVELCVNLGKVSKQNIIYIGSIPHAQVLVL